MKCSAAGQVLLAARDHRRLDRLLFQSEVLNLARNRVATYAQPARGVNPPAVRVFQCGADNGRFELARQSVHQIRCAGP